MNDNNDNDQTDFSWIALECATKNAIGFLMERELVSGLSCDGTPLRPADSLEDEAWQSSIDEQVELESKTECSFSGRKRSDCFNPIQCDCIDAVSKISQAR